MTERRINFSDGTSKILPMTADEARRLAQESDPLPGILNGVLEAVERAARLGKRTTTINGPKEMPRVEVELHKLGFTTKSYSGDFRDALLLQLIGDIWIWINCWN
ncbi:hypothetical protein [Xanthomonas phage JGB6]|nr:hypothetical protein [Xanthomonas phage JGB6]